MTRALPEPTYRRFVPGLGTLSLRPFDLDADVKRLFLGENAARLLELDSHLAAAESV